jgi:hypothetical protein
MKARRLIGHPHADNLSPRTAAYPDGRSGARAGVRWSFRGVLAEREALEFLMGCQGVHREQLVEQTACGSRVPSTLT